MSRKVDFSAIGIGSIPMPAPWDPRRFDIYAIGDRFRKRLAYFGLTDEEIKPMAQYFLGALYYEKPWPPNPPFDAPEHYTGPTFDE